MIHGIDIQFLDGVNDCSYDGIHGVFDRMRKRVSTANTRIAQSQTIKNPIAHSMSPQMRKRYRRFQYDKQANAANEIDTIIKGLDFAGFSGENLVEDDEMLLNHLVRTKSIIERAPSTIAAYQNPEAFNQMLGYVIDNWDTPEREKALDIAAEEEERLISVGAISMPESDENYEILYGDDIAANLYNPEEYEVSPLGTVRLKRQKSGFFRNIQKLNSNAALTNDARKFKNEVQDAFLKKKIGKKRGTIAQSRRRIKKSTIAAGTPEQKTITQEVAQSSDVINGLGSTFGIEDQFDDVYRGLTLVGALGAVSSIEEDTDAVRNHLMSVREVMSQSPQEYFDSKEEAQLAIGAVDYITVNWDNPIARMKALDNLEGVGLTEEQHEDLLCGICGIDDEYGNDDLGALGAKKKKKKGIFKKIAKKVKGAVKKVATATKKVVKKTAKVVKTAAKKTATAVKTAAKKTGKAVKTAAKKTGKAIKTAAKKTGKAIKTAAKKVGKFVKKVVKAIVRFNPISLLAKGGVLVAMRTNMFKLAQKLYPALEPDEARAAGYSEEDIENAKKAFEKTNKIFSDRLLGKRAKLEKAIRKGAKKKWTGGETFNKSEMEAAANNVSDAEQQQVDAEVEADRQELIAQGAQFDSNGTSADVVVEQHPNGVEVEVAVSGLLGLDGPATVAAVAAATPVLVAIISAVNSIIKNRTAKIENKTAQITEGESFDEEQAEMSEGEEEYYEPTEDEQSMLDQIMLDPGMIDNPLVMQAIAENPKLANNPAIQAAKISQVTQQGGLSKGAKIGLAVGGGVALIAILALALKPKKQAPQYTSYTPYSQPY